MEVGVEEVFEIFLFAGALFGFAEFREHEFFEALEVGFAGFDILAVAGIKRAVTIGHEVLEFPVGEDLTRDFEGERVGIHAADVAMEEILEISRWAAEFGVEVEATFAQSTGAQNRNHRETEFLNVGIELIGVPTEEWITGVGINRSEHALGGGDIDLMREGMAGEGSVIGFDVELEMFLEAVGAEEGDAAGDIEIVLMLGGFLRFGLDQELPFETNLLRVVDRHVHEAREVLLFAFEIGIEECFVTFTATPENVIFAAEFLGCVHRALHLGCGISEYVGIGIGGGTAHEARIGKQIGGAPEEFNASLFLEGLRVGDDLGEVLVGLRERTAFGRDVAIVETPEGSTDFLEEFEGGIHAILRDGELVFSFFPRTHDRAGAERIGTRATE